MCVPFSRNLHMGEGMRGVMSKATVTLLTLTEPLPGSVGPPWSGISFELEGPSEVDDICFVRVCNVPESRLILLIVIMAPIVKD